MSELIFFFLLKSDLSLNSFRLTLTSLSEDFWHNYVPLERLQKNKHGPPQSLEGQ